MFDFWQVRQLLTLSPHCTKSIAVDIPPGDGLVPGRSPLARVTSTYLRKMSGKMIIPSRCIRLVDCVGQGEDVLGVCSLSHSSAKHTKGYTSVGLSPLPPCHVSFSQHIPLSLYASYRSLLLLILSSYRNNQIVPTRVCFRCLFMYVCKSTCSQTSVLVQLTCR